MRNTPLKHPVVTRTKEGRQPRGLEPAGASCPPTPSSGAHRTAALVDSGGGALIEPRASHRVTATPTHSAGEGYAQLRLRDGHGAQGKMVLRNLGRTGHACTRDAGLHSEDGMG